MVYVLTEGWKELKVGTISEVIAEPTLDPVTLEEEPLARAQQHQLCRPIRWAGGDWATGLAGGDPPRMAAGVRDGSGGGWRRLDLEPGE